MSKTHEGHDHQHGPACGHVAIKHEGHTDYLHDGHLHHAEPGWVEERTIGSGSAAPRTPTTARRNTSAAATSGDTSTVRIAAIPPSRTATTSITWSMGTYIIRTATTATITARSRRREDRRRPGDVLPA